MNRINILIVEDESIVATEIQSYLDRLGYHVVGICSRGEDILDRFENSQIDILIMDIHLKGASDGIDTASNIIRKYPQTKIIFLTAHMDDEHVNRALPLDPVAYLSKSFNRKELKVFLKIATLKIANAHISAAENSSCQVLDNEFCYNTNKNTLFYCNEPIYLTKKESELLDILIKNKNFTVDFYTLANHIWPEKSIHTNTLRTLVRRVRQKLKHKFIETVTSQGYRLIIK